MSDSVLDEGGAALRHRPIVPFPAWSRSAPAGLAQTANNEGLSPSSVCVCLSEGDGGGSSHSGIFAVCVLKRPLATGAQSSPHHHLWPPSPEGSLGEWRQLSLSGLSGHRPGSG